MALREILKNERITNQANYLLTVITTLLSNYLFNIINQQVEPDMRILWFLIGSWATVFVLRLIERYAKYIFEESKDKSDIASTTFTPPPPP